VTLLAALLLALITHTTHAQTVGHRRVRIPASVSQILVRQAIDGARDRLRRTDCAAVLDEFTDPDGHTLRENLRAMERTVTQYLMDIWFLDGTGSDLCSSGDVAAFTTPRSRVVYVCAARFGSVSDTLCGPAGEIIVIHELLHTLGLGENPPSSAEITQRIWRRCG